MENPGNLIRRAASKDRILPREKPAEQRLEPERTPPPVSRHGSYTALMRSHDRVHTRHIPGK